MQVYMEDGTRVGGEQVEEELPMVRRAAVSVQIGIQVVCCMAEGRGRPPDAYRSGYSKHLRSCERCQARCGACR